MFDSNAAFGALESTIPIRKNNQWLGFDAFQQKVVTLCFGIDRYQLPGA